MAAAAATTTMVRASSTEHYHYLLPVSVPVGGTQEEHRDPQIKLKQCLVIVTR